MVSYYNPLSQAMFPNPPQMGVAARHQPSAAAAAAHVAANHAYFQNYHAHAAAAYGHAHPHAQYGHYVASDLNSNMYNGQMASASTASAAAAAASASGPNSAVVGGSENWSNWPPFGHQPSTLTSNGGCRFDLWPPSGGEDSPPTPTGQNDVAVNGRTSPGNYGTNQSHSSGSPSATPTPSAQAFHLQQFNANSASSFQPQPQQPQHSPNNVQNQLTNQQCSSLELSPINNHLDHGHPLASPAASSLASPTSRPQPARSPYEWMKKPSYQSQPEKSGKSFCINS
jgi:hypothetical protein